MAILVIWIHLALCDAAQFWVQTRQTSDICISQAKRNKKKQRHLTQPNLLLFMCTPRRHMRCISVFFTGQVSSCSACPGPNNGPWERHRIMGWMNHGTIRDHKMGERLGEFDGFDRIRDEFVESLSPHRKSFELILDCLSSLIWTENAGMAEVEPTRISCQLSPLCSLGQFSTLQPAPVHLSIKFHKFWQSSQG